VLPEHLRQRSNLVAAAIGLVLFAAAIIKVPVPLGQGRDLAVGLFQSGVLIIFLSVLWRVNKWVALFLILVIVSRTLNITLQSQHAMTCVIFGVGLYFLIYEYGDYGILLDTMCVIAFAHLLAVLVQFSGVPSVFTKSIVGITYNPNECSAMFALCFPAFLRPGKLAVFGLKIPYRFLIVIPIFGLALTPSFGGVLAVSLGMVFYCTMTVQWVLIPVAIGVILFLIFGDRPGAGVRWGAWSGSLEMLFTGKVVSADSKEYTSPISWIWGCGIGHWKVIANKLYQANVHLSPLTTAVWTRLHNSFINGFVELGICFPVLVLGYLAGQVKKYKQVIPITALIIIIGCCSVNSMFRMNAINAMIAITWLAILEYDIPMQEGMDKWGISI